ncbi:MAG: triose-phosphate isomerase [Anaerolineae bacterium]
MPAPPEYIGDVHRFVRSHLTRQYGSAADDTRVIYGGSVNLSNAAEIIAQADVDGMFVGRAALEPHSFAHLIRFVETEAVRASRR